MPAHIMELPRLVVVGNGVSKNLGDSLQGLDMGKKGMVVSGPIVKKILESQVGPSLEVSGVKFTWEIVGASSFAEVERVSSLAREGKADFLIGAGGGRSIDIAKLASFECKIPFISVPTSASHDGISSPFGSVRGLDRPYSLVAKPPLAIVADTDLISQAPHKLLVSGCGDLISKKTAVKDWELGSAKTGEYYGRYSANLALLSANMIMEDAESISSIRTEGISVVVEALISFRSRCGHCWKQSAVQWIRTSVQPCHGNSSSGKRDAWRKMWHGHDHDGQTSRSGLFGN